MRARRRAAAVAVAVLALLAGLLLRRATAPAPPVAPAIAGPVATAIVPDRPPPGLPIRVPVGPQPARDEAPASFEGRVVAADDGAGVAGAELTFSRAGAADTVRAGEGGAFRFVPPAEGRWLLAAVTAPGFLPFAPEWGHSPVQLDAAAGRHVRGLEIHLARAVALAGKVVDAEGAPVAGASVRLLGAAGEAALVAIPDRFTSGGDGAFSFSAPEGATLEARRDGFLPGRAEVDAVAIARRRIVVALGPAEPAPGPPEPISGRAVAPDGAPIEGALVAASTPASFGGGPALAQALSDADGRFELPPLDPGVYDVVARHPARAPATARHVAAGTRDLVLELAGGGRLRGCVRDASTGAPVAPFTVMVFARAGLRLVPRRSVSVVDPAGCYALDDLAPGPAVVVVSAPGRAPSPERAVDVPPPPGEAVADAALDPGGALFGVVRDEATRAPVAGARVAVEGILAASSSAFPVLSSAVTDAAGRFEVAGLPRRVALSVVADGYHGRIVSGLETGAGERRGPVEVPLRPAAPGEEPRIDFAGIGAVLSAGDDALTIVQVVPGGGAAEAGLGRGDLVLGVDGRPVAELGFAGCVDAIRGPEGTVVVLTVRRGDAVRDVPVPRRIVRG